MNGNVDRMETRISSDNSLNRSWRFVSKIIDKCTLAKTITTKKKERYTIKKKKNLIFGSF